MGNEIPPLAGRPMDKSGTVVPSVTFAAVLRNSWRKATAAVVFRRATAWMRIGAAVEMLTTLPATAAPALSNSLSAPNRPVAIRLPLGLFRFQLTCASLDHASSLLVPVSGEPS